ncbi:MAG: sigma-70 family RNA polymerase sigma factor [Gemmataceae bacterium]|nr:sigma-70 family RNA polymerase sigma factor [Gemmataceae bacterium]
MPIFEATHFAGLLDEARHGSTEALGKLLEGFRTQLLLDIRRRASAKVVAHADHAELVQETFQAAVPAFPGFRGGTEAEMVGWLQQILRNQLRDRNRYLKARKRDAGRPLSLDQESPHGALRDCILDSDATPCTSSSQRERQEIMDRALRQLKPKYQQMIALRNGTTKEFTEIAADLGTTPDAAMKTWNRALKAWRDEMVKLGLTEF